MYDVVGTLALLLLAVVFVSIARWAWKRGRSALKWGVTIISALLAAIVGCVLVVALVGFYKLNVSPYKPAAADPNPATAPEQLARGTRLLSLCAGCHAPNGRLPLVGQDFLTDGPPSGILYAPNLTPAGEIKDWSDAEVVRAIREGVHKNGRPLIIMPAPYFRNLSDEDVMSIVAALRAMPAAGTMSPPTKLNIVGALLVGSGMANITAQPPITQPVVAPPQGPTAEYGAYLVSVMLCRDCHGKELAGGVAAKFGPPVGPNLTQIVPHWSEEGFLRTLRTGVDPFNHQLTKDMPWEPISGATTDDDLKAIYAYLHSLPPRLGPSAK